MGTPAPAKSADASSASSRIRRPISGVPDESWTATGVATGRGGARGGRGQRGGGGPRGAGVEVVDVGGDGPAGGRPAGTVVVVARRGGPVVVVDGAGRTGG